MPNKSWSLPPRNGYVRHILHAVCSSVVPQVVEGSEEEATVSELVSWYISEHPNPRRPWDDYAQLEPRLQMLERLVVATMTGERSRTLLDNPRVAQRVSTAAGEAGLTAVVSFLRQYLRNR